MKKIGIIHTGFVTKEVINNSLKQMIPDVEIVNVVDDSLLNEVIKNGFVSKQVMHKMYLYAKALEEQGVDIILNQCSSVSEVVDYITPFLDIPYVKIDLPMVEYAVSKFEKIGVVASLETTLGPSSRLVEKTAEQLGKQVTVMNYLAEGAFKEITENNNVEKHNEMVLEVIKNASSEVDVILLAQGSMHVIVPETTGLGVEVLTSIDSGLTQIKEFYDQA